MLGTQGIFQVEETAGEKARGEREESVFGQLQATVCCRFRVCGWKLRLKSYEQDTSWRPQPDDTVRSKGK